MQSINSRAAIFRQRVSVRPARVKKSVAAPRRAAINNRGISTLTTTAQLNYDPDQYDEDANRDRGSGFVPNVATLDGSRPTNVRYGSDGVVYDPDQYDPDANVRSSGAIYSPPAATFTSPPSSSSPGSAGVVTEADVRDAQNLWATSIVDISRCFLQGGDYVALGGERAGMLYGYGHSDVLFKPTKAAQHQFRPTANEAMSYFVGGDVIPGGYGEDHGFAINAKKGFSKVVFNNHAIDCYGDVALAMGTYDFTCATTGDVSSVEYTFGYTRNADGKVRICLHHSSIPYGPH